MTGDVILATNGHPFWFPELGQRVDAIDLAPGNLAANLRRNLGPSHRHPGVDPNRHRPQPHRPRHPHLPCGCRGRRHPRPQLRWRYCPLRKVGLFFGRVTSGSHNTPRSTQNAAQLNRIGIHDTPEGCQILNNFFDDQVSRSDSIIREYADKHGTFQVRDGLLAGPGGFLHVESTWRATDTGLSITTIIPRGG